MTSSQKSTDSGSWAPSLSIGAAAVLGMGLVLRAYEYNVSPSTIALMLGWCALIATGVLLWKSMLSVSSPGSDATRIASQITEGRRGDLEREKRALLRSIKDAEFDRDMGKMDAEDAQQIIRVYRARAIEIIKELDSRVSADAADAPIDDLIERELAARLAARTPAANPASPQAAGDAAVDSADESAAGGSAGSGTVSVDRPCGACDAVNDGDAAFCNKCGARLEAVS